ncbi:MAG: hypothetical protein ACOZCO_03595 [Bacteroidota bacterium]
MKKRLFSLWGFLCAFCVAAQNELPPVDVADLNIKIPAMMDDVEYYGFSEGDIIVLNFNEEKGKSLKYVEVLEYPSSSKFKDFEAKEIKEKRIQVNKTGIYQFVFSNSSLSGRICNIKIQRIPASDATKNFNTTVKWRQMSDTTWTTHQEKYISKTSYVPKQVHPVQEFWINSTSNETWKGGTTRIVLPVSLPANTVEWYYQFSASRSKDEMAKTKMTFNLVGNLASLIDQTGAISFGLDLLTVPPGSDYCDIYLCTPDNGTLFHGGYAFSYFPSSSRENYKSGVIKVTGSNLISGSWNIAMKNNDSYYGIAVAVEVVAIVKEIEYATREIRTPHVKTWKEPYLE